MDMMSYLRLKNVMGGQDDGSDDGSDLAPSDDGMYGGDNTSNPPPIDMAARMKQLYQPSNVANEALTSHLSSMPQRDDFHASVGRKVLATIAGMGAGASPAGIAGGSPVGFRGNPGAAFKTASGIIDDPYNQATNDWENKLKPLETNAQLEDKDNTNNRIAANNTMSREISDNNSKTRRDDELRKAKNDDETKRHHEANEKAAQSRIEAKNYANTHPAMKSFTGKDGFIYFYDPHDKNGKGIKTDIVSKDMNDWDKLAIRHDNTIDEINTRGQNAMDLEDDKQEGHIALKKTAGPLKPSNPGSDTTDETTTVIGPDGKTKTVTHKKSVTPKGAGNNQPNNQVEDVTKVPKEKRVIGKTYRLANGTIGKWVGTGFTAVQ